MLDKTLTEQLVQIWNGATWDGNLISSSRRDELEARGLVVRYSGWNLVTLLGARYILDNGLARTGASAGGQHAD